jgi:hypothetical protein
MPGFSHGPIGQVTSFYDLEEACQQFDIDINTIIAIEQTHYLNWASSHIRKITLVLLGLNNPCNGCGNVTLHHNMSQMLNPHLTFPQHEPNNSSEFSIY